MNELALNQLVQIKNVSSSILELTTLSRAPSAGQKASLRPGTEWPQFVTSQEAVLCLLLFFLVLLVKCVIRTILEHEEAAGRGHC